MTDIVMGDEAAEPQRPASVAARSAYVRAAMLGGFEGLVSTAGGDAARLAAEVGIPARALHDPDMVISWTAVGALMERAEAVLGKPSLGLEWLRATPEPLLSFGAIALIARFTTTIGDWCSHSRDYWHWHTNASRAVLLEEEGGELLKLRVSFSERVPLSRHQVEYIMGGVCVLLDILTRAARDGLVLVRFRHPRPAEVDLHEAVFPCPVEFGCEHNELVYRRRLHEHSIEIAPEAAAAWLTRYVEARIRTIPDYDGSTRAKVEIAIPSLIGTRFCTQPCIAQLLSIGPKTLQRQLTRESGRFVDLLDKTRERMARQFLAESEIPVASIAGLLGYTNTPPFTAAVHRWTGKSPRQFRDQARQARGPSS
jgi:AraC-like DNA-binding protein